MSMIEIGTFLRKFLPALCIVFTASCTREKTPVTDILPGSEEATVSFLLESPVHLPTKAGTAADNQIETLDVLAFSADVAGDTYLYRARSVTVENTDVVNVKKVSATVIKSADPQRFVLIANAVPQVGALGDPAEGTDKTALLEPLAFSKNTEWSNAADDFDPIPMWGESAAVTIGDAEVSLGVKLLRMAARVDVYMAGDSDLPKLSELYVYNASSRGRIVPDDGNLVYQSGESAYVAEAPTLPEDNDPSDPLTLTGELAHSADPLTGIFPAVYLFEADAGTALADAPCLILKGYHKDDTSPSYYRLDFAALEDDGTFGGFKPVLRNHRYVFSITKVEGPGYGTAREAFEGGGYNLGFRLYIWDQEEMTEFVFNSSHALGVSRKEFTVEKPESVNELLVTTDYPLGWKATVDPAKYDWLTIVSGTFTDVNAKDPLYFRVKENDSGGTRTGYITVTAGTLVQTIEVTQTEEGSSVITGANTYMLAPGGNTVSIPLNWANKDGNQRILPSDDIEVEFIWMDRPAGMSASGAVSGLTLTGEGDVRELAVTSGSAAGNAVVGVSKGGTLLWSWLIWVTEYAPDNGGTTYSANGFTVMDRNLGAVTNDPDAVGAIGLYFQWARKDPFPQPPVLSYSGDSAPKLQDSEVYARNGLPLYASHSTASLLNDPETGVREPLVFFTGARAVSESYLWKESDGSKGMQDPCPEGWRLPPNSTAESLWTGVTITQSSDHYVVLSGLGVWPLGGYLTSSSSGYGMLGLYAMMWSNDVSANAAYLFSAGKSTGIQQQWPYYLYAGAPARCVAEY